jgi:hypothetical protein
MSFIGAIHGHDTPQTYGKYYYRAGNVSATVSVPSNGFVDTVSAESGDTASTVQVGTGDIITVPPYSTITLDVSLGLKGPIDIVFTDIIAYFVDWRVVS